MHQGKPMLLSSPDNDLSDLMMISAADYPVDTAIIIRTPMTGDE